MIVSESYADKVYSFSEIQTEIFQEREIREKSASLSRILAEEGKELIDQMKKCKLSSDSDSIQSNSISTNSPSGSSNSSENYKNTSSDVSENSSSLSSCNYETANKPSANVSKTENSNQYHCNTNESVISNDLEEG